MDNVYVNLKETLNNMDNGGLLVGNNLEWAREAVLNASAINLDRHVNGTIIVDILNFLKEEADKCYENHAYKYADGIMRAVEVVATTLYNTTKNSDFDHF
jgi:hypothetical protein